MSQNNSGTGYIPPKEWDRMKYKEVSPEYVKNFLHHEGLKCLTDGLTYCLDPDDDSDKPPLPDLHLAEDGAIGRRVEVTLGRLQEVDPEVK